MDVVQCLVVEDSATDFGGDCRRGGSAEDTLFGNCRRPCYVEAQRAAGGQVRSAAMVPNTCR